MGTDALAEIRAVAARAKHGDAAAVPRLRELLDRHPEVWQTYGDLAVQVERSWIDLAGGSDLHLKESVTRYAAKLRTELTRPSAPPVEKLLVERAVATWLQLHYFSAVEANALAADAPPRLVQFRAKRQAQAHRLHERALSALVAFQKLVPVVADPTPAPVGAATRTPAAIPFQAVDAVTDQADEAEPHFYSTPDPDAELVRVVSR